MEEKLTVKIPALTLLKMYECMVRIRRLEEIVGELVCKKEIKCPSHLYIGQEAVAVGVCSSLKREDYIFGTHRSHGHYLAKGGNLKELLAELYGRLNGCSRGKGGSMHVVAPEVGLLGTPAIVAGGIPLAVGTALASVLKGEKRVSVAFFGDGATNEGVFYESLNFASLKKLPVIFVCENNYYSTHMPISACLADTNIKDKAKVFNMPGFRLNGNDVIEVFQKTREAVEKAREGGGPSLIECLTYRWRGHVGPHYDLDKGLRSQEELNWWMGRCPIKRLEKTLLDEEIISSEEKHKIVKRIDEEIGEAVRFAKKSPYPGEDELYRDVFKG